MVSLVIRSSTRTRKNTSDRGEAKRSLVILTGRAARTLAAGDRRLDRDAIPHLDVRDVACEPDDRAGELVAEDDR
jgi:hypothetical protein